MKTLRRKTKKYPISLWLDAAGVISTACAATVEGGLRPDRKRLSDAELTELTQLTGEGAEGGGFTLSRLDRKDAGRWEQLVEKAAGREPGSVFQHARDMAELHVEMRKLAREARKPARRVELHEEGSVTLQKQWCFDFLDRPDGTDPVFWISHLGLLVFLMSQFENGQALVKGGAMEGLGDDAVLLIDTRIGLGGHLDGDEAFMRWPEVLDHLVANSFFEVERKGPMVRVKLGSRLRKTARKAAA